MNDPDPGRLDDLPAPDAGDTGWYPDPLGGKNLRLWTVDRGWTFEVRKEPPTPNARESSQIGPQATFGRRHRRALIGGALAMAAGFGVAFAFPDTDQRKETTSIEAVEDAREQAEVTSTATVLESVSVTETIETTTTIEEN